LKLDPGHVQAVDNLTRIQLSFPNGVLEAEETFTCALQHSPANAQLLCAFADFLLAKLIRTGQLPNVGTSQGGGTFEQSARREAMETGGDTQVRDGIARVQQVYLAAMRVDPNHVRTRQRYAEFLRDFQQARNPLHQHVLASSPSKITQARRRSSRQLLHPLPPAPQLHLRRQNSHC
jgi:hypothetical protein